MSYPPEEHAEHVSFMDTPLPNLLMRQQEMIFEAERRAHEAEDAAKRWDEGVVRLEWMLARHGGELPAMVVLQFVGEVVLYANVGREVEWLRRAGEAMGRAS